MIIPFAEPWMTYPVVLLVREDLSNDAMTLTQLDKTIESIGVLHEHRPLSFESPLVLHISVAILVCKRHTTIVFTTVFFQGICVFKGSD